MSTYGSDHPWIKADLAAEAKFKVHCDTGRHLDTFLCLAACSLLGYNFAKLKTGKDCHYRKLFSGQYAGQKMPSLHV